MPIGRAPGFPGGFIPWRVKEDVVRLDLANPENHEEVSNWIKNRVNNFISEHFEFVMTLQLYDQLREIVEELAKKLNVNIEPSIIDAIVDFDEEATPHPDDLFGTDNETVDGTFSLMGEDIFNYGSFSDGSSFSIKEWIDKGLETAVPKLVEYLKSQNK